jgi:hypothetical protein
MHEEFQTVYCSGQSPPPDSRHIGQSFGQFHDNLEEFRTSQIQSMGCGIV